MSFLLSAMKTLILDVDSHLKHSLPQFCSSDMISFLSCNGLGGNPNLDERYWADNECSSDHRLAVIGVLL